MNNVDFILDQTAADDVRAITSGILRFFSDEVFAGRGLDDHARFRLWAASTAASARLIELTDVQRVKTAAVMEHWAKAPTSWHVTTTDPDAPVGEVPPVTDWQHLMGASVSARRWVA